MKNNFRGITFMKKWILVFVSCALLTNCMQHQTWWPHKPQGDISNRNHKKSKHYQSHKHPDNVRAAY
jgi:hypothetical protein